MTDGADAYRRTMRPPRCTPILATLKERGLDPEALRPEDLKPRRVDAYRRLAGDRGRCWRGSGCPGRRALDIGCGVGGTARTLAVQHGATVTGVST